ncbi:uncharacterized protein N7443_000203 [Penicillium atrosanguineum]|uniref:uncharacterized protein n=1 Tax=Penicillium atrosanguineum TaxID=1132637 RepID=UPI00239399D4|nr:uncharacterized protein N7443_000203 [Penicillium atrosanguineum]KAJ5313319.1 hypothetical protein N7443_000203 [Penicillium atrosanguineum]
MVFGSGPLALWGPILILLSGASYLPQLHRIWVHGNCQGISLGYLLLNLISAPEHFTTGFFILVNHKGGTDLFVETPLTTGDWLNLAQLTLNSFIICLWFPSDNRTGHKLGLLTVYILFTLISIIPFFIDAIDHDFFGPRGSSDRNWAEAFFSGWHMMLMHPIVTILALVALPCQARAIRALPVGNVKALSLLRLLTQGVVFSVVAISWTMRVKFMDLSFRDVIAYGWLTVVSWYQMVGWAAVNNAVFALVQRSLFCLARNWGVVKMADREREPLLGALDYESARLSRRQRQGSSESPSNQRRAKNQQGRYVSPPEQQPVSADVTTTSNYLNKGFKELSPKLRTDAVAPDAPVASFSSKLLRAWSTTPTEEHNYPLPPIYHATNSFSVVFRDFRNTRQGRGHARQLFKYPDRLGEL